MQLIIMDVNIPVLESGPYSRKISRTSPVAAEEENILMNISGTTSLPSPHLSRLSPKSVPISDKKPDARSTPTATISPISVGMIFTTILRPSTAPYTKQSYTSTFFIIPVKMIPITTRGITILERTVSTSIISPSDISF